MFDTIKLKFNKNDLDFVKRYANEENLDLDACCKKNSFRLSWRLLRLFTFERWKKRTYKREWTNKPWRLKKGIARCIE